VSVLTDRLPFPGSKKVFLIEQTAGEQLNLWALAAGQTYTYWCATVLHVDDVKENGISITAQASIANVEANAASYFWDQAAGRVYVHCTGGVAPTTKTLQAIVSFFFSTEGRVYNGIYYDPRIKALPSLSMRVERVFGDPGQLGSGTAIYENGDGFFDLLSGLQWDAGRVVLKMGIDDPHSPFTKATYAEFDTVGTWNVKSWAKSDTEFKVNLEEIKGNTKIKIPLEHYTRDEFPYMREEDVGKVKQIAYGQIFDIAPVCVNVSEKRFRVAGHAIQGFFGIRMKSAVTGYWVDTTFTTIDGSLAEFTVTDWDMKAEIAVDFFGKMNLDGTLMDNPADVVKDILMTYLGAGAVDIQ
jgi:hypothetical protein